jgi:hypothetical protein
MSFRRSSNFVIVSPKSVAERSLFSSTCPTLACFAALVDQRCGTIRFVRIRNASVYPHGLCFRDVAAVEPRDVIAILHVSLTAKGIYGRMDRLYGSRETNS